MEPQSEPQNPISQDIKEETNKLSNITLHIWPPTQRTRDAVIKRLVETLSTPSVLSKRYGTVPEDEAATAASAIENEAFSVAGASFSPESDGIEVLQIYSKEISKRMLEIVKARAGATASPTASGSVVIDSTGEPTGATKGEEVTSASIDAEA